jgi:hypothetical protein
MQLGIVPIPRCIRLIVIDLLRNPVFEILVLLLIVLMDVAN